MVKKKRRKKNNLNNSHRLKLENTFKKKKRHRVRYIEKEDKKNLAKRKIKKT